MPTTLDYDYSSLPNVNANLANKTALVTGATGRLSPAICQGLLNAGANLILVGRKSSKLENLANHLGSGGQSIRTFARDLADDASRDELVALLVNEVESLDILVNNAYSGNTGTVESSTREDFKAALDVGITSIAELTRGLLPLMEFAVEKNKDASVINIASMYGVVSPDPRIYGNSSQNSPPYYAAVKGAIIQYNRYLAVHLAEKRIRVNAISPGPMPSLSIRESSPDFYAELRNKVPMGRIGVPEDMIGPILFLASPASRYVTGVNLLVDGGWTAW